MKLPFEQDETDLTAIHKISATPKNQDRDEESTWSRFKVFFGSLLTEALDLSKDWVRAKIRHKNSEAFVNEGDGWERMAKAQKTIQEAQIQADQKSNLKEAQIVPDESGEELRKAKRALEDKLAILELELGGKITQLPDDRHGEESE